MAQPIEHFNRTIELVATEGQAITMGNGHRFFSIGDKSYFVHPKAVGKLCRAGLSKPKPIVLIASVNEDIDIDASVKAVSELSDAGDDVYSEEFLNFIVIQTPSQVQPRLDELDLTIRTAQGRRSVLGLFSQAANDQDLVPSGPYYVYENDIHQVSLLRRDYLDAFIFAVVRSESNPQKFSVLGGAAGDGVSKRVAVPSRHYAPPSDSQPLAGMRISIKDNFQLAGVKTTNLNRAFSELYPPDKDSADYVKKLLDLGAIVVGKTKMCTFATSDEPTDQWIDYHCPFSPRGDGYQSPSGSSTGAAVSVAGYDWLDISIGTDTTGSIRAPATANGLFGIRSSLGVTSMQGIFPVCSAFDTIGFLSRDLEYIYRFMKHSLQLDDSFKVYYGSMKEIWLTNKPPRRILYATDFFPHQNQTQQSLVEDFVRALETSAGVTKTDISFAAEWAARPPAASGGESLEEYMDNSAFWPFYYDTFHNSAKFRKDYKDRFGKEPYVGPIARFRWKKGSKITAEEKEAGLARIQVFRDWFNKHILECKPGEVCDTILIMPSGQAVPKYRDKPNRGPFVMPTLSEQYIATILEVPQLIIPIGQVPYKSRISKRVEQRPICGSIIGGKGSDLNIIKVALAALQNAGWPTKVEVGRFTFKPKDREATAVKKE